VTSPTTEPGRNEGKTRIAVISGATATVLNSAPLITSNKAREKSGLALLTDSLGAPQRFDALRPQRLAAPVVVYVEQHSAHPLESDASDLYGPPDGYLDENDEFKETADSASDRPVYKIELRPEDGLYPLPYMAVQADGTPWDAATSVPLAPAERSRQTFYPDASRVFEEIDRLGVDEYGSSNLVGNSAEFDFYRAVPSGGYTKGLSASARSDVGEGPIAPEVWGTDFFPYHPGHLRHDPPSSALATLTNRVMSWVASGAHDGFIWLEGSPAIEETLYWLNLLVDTTSPIVGVASSDWPHGCLGAGGDRNLVHAVRYIRSRVWADDNGRNVVGAVLVDAERALAAREVQKADARPGGFTVSGGHGGVVATLGDPGAPVLTSIPPTRNTNRSDVRFSELPGSVEGVALVDGSNQSIRIETRDGSGDLVPEAIPHVSIFKHARYLTTGTGLDAETEIELMARIRSNLTSHSLAGFVVEANAPYGSSAVSADAALRIAAMSGMPVVRVGRGNTEGWVPKERMRLAIAGANLTATKARMLLIAGLLKFGALPPAADPTSPTVAEIESVSAALQPYQQLFDTH
jgi:hypothetical protein